MNSPCDPQRIESRINELVRRHVAAGADTVPGALEPILTTVVDQAAASSEGGKRLRARLALDAYDVMRPRAASAEAEAMFDMACAIEVFQTGALVHDDIIDDSDMRRGRPSAHRALEASTSPAIGMGLGLMLGDLLATACMAIMDEAVAALPHADELRAAFIAMHHDVEIGQVLDLAIERMGLDDPDALREASHEVFRWKTASYTTIAPLHLAMLAAGLRPDRARGHAMAIGLPLGVAFQLADDLLDVVGSPRATGKPVGGDVREGKRTVMLADALAAADARQARLLRDAYDAPERDETQVRAVLDLFEATGAVEASRARIARMWAQTLDAIDALGLDGEARDALTRACARFVPADCRGRGRGAM